MRICLRLLDACLDEEGMSDKKRRPTHNLDEVEDDGVVLASPAAAKKKKANNETDLNEKALESHLDAQIKEENDDNDAYKRVMVSSARQAQGGYSHERPSQRSDQCSTRAYRGSGGANGGVEARQSLF